MKLCRESADVLDHMPPIKALSPRARKRSELDASPEPVIRDAAHDPGVAFRISLYLATRSPGFGPTPDLLIGDLLGSCPARTPAEVYGSRHPCWNDSRRLVRTASP
jgi:hypothetical protein